MSAEADNVGSAHCLFNGLNRVCPAICSCKLLCVGEVFRCNADLGKLAHTGEHLQMRTALHPSADNRQHAGIRTCQESSRESCSASRAERCDVRSIHEREGRASLSVEQADDSLV